MRNITFLGLFGISALLVFCGRSEAEDDVAQQVIPGLVMRQGNGTPLTIHPKDKKIHIKDDRLFGAGGNLLAVLVRQRSEAVSCYAFSPDGRLLAVGICYDSIQKNKDGTLRGYVRLYEVSSGRLLWDSGAPVIGPVEHISFSKEGDAILYRSGRVVFEGGK